MRPFPFFVKPVLEFHSIICVMDQHDIMIYYSAENLVEKENLPYNLRIPIFQKKKNSGISLKSLGCCL